MARLDGRRWDARRRGLWRWPSTWDRPDLRPSVPLEAPVPPTLAAAHIPDRWHRGALLLLHGTSAAGGLSLSLPTLASGAAVYPPSLAPGDVGLSLPTIAGGSTANPPTVRPRVALPTLASAAAVNPPTLRGHVSLPTLASGAAVSPPVLRYRVSLPTISGAPTLGAPVLRYQVALPTLASGATVSPPTVIGEALLLLPTIASGAALNAPSVSLVGGGSQSLSLPTLTGAPTLYPPTLRARVALPAIGGAAAVYAPTLRARLALPTIASGAAVSPPVLVPEFLLELPTIGSAAAVYAPDEVAGGTLPEPTDPPTVRRWKDEPRGRHLPLWGFDFYAVRLAVGTIAAGSSKTRLVPIRHLTSRQAFLWTPEGSLQPGVYLAHVYLSVPGVLVFTYVNYGAVDRYQDLHDVNVLVLGKSLPLT